MIPLGSDDQDLLDRSAERETSQQNQVNSLSRARSNISGNLIVRSRAPLRLGLAGGGTDVSPYCDQFGGAVLNATIDHYAYTIIEPTEDGRIVLAAADLGETFEMPAERAMTIDYPLILHRAVCRRVADQFNRGRPFSCRITTFCDAPPGSGLGTSSTMVVSLLKAFVEWLNLPLGEYEIARLAFEIERQDAQLMGGRQDQYAASFGGVNFMEFWPADRVIVNPLRVKNWILSEFEASLVLFNSGVSRSSAKIIAEQTTNVATNEASVAAMHELKADAIGMKEALLKGDMRMVGSFMRKSWEAKKQMAKGITTRHIEQVYDAAMKAGALAGKVSGAGGGGFITFLVDPPRRSDVIRALGAQEGRVTICHFTKHGTEGWKVYR
jgi:D-glycero-alpha-D-manno-heptose-7-phosphate kinase